MPEPITRGEPELEFFAQVAQASSRRKFLKWTGLTVAVAVVGCDKETTAPDASPQLDRGPGTNATVNLGAGDIGILNYAYALEQLEAAFYLQVVASPYGGISGEEMAILTDVRDHEVIHRDFFKTALGAAAIPGLSVNFTSVDFTSRQSVLTTAQTFEDIGVSAYNGAGRLLQDPGYLLVAGKIVSVEARHAAAIRDLLRPKTRYFAGNDVVDPATGLDVARSPQQVLKLAQPFIQDRVKGEQLPTA